jgi:hypothetical protein
MKTKTVQLLNEGGNVEIDGIAAQRLDLNKISRSKVVAEIDKALKIINSTFNKMYGVPLWSPELINNKEFLSGSAFHFFNVKIPDDQFTKVKSSVGDIDTMVDKDLAEKAKDFLTKATGKQFGPAKLVGFKPSPGQDTLISLWQFNDPPVAVQVDMELVDYDKGSPTEWSKFSHSSAWEDLSAGIKGVFHKYLLRSLTHKDAKDRYIQMKTKLKKVNASDLAFAVTGGVREKFEPVIDPKTKKPAVADDGLGIYKEIPASEGNYTTDIKGMFTLLVGRKPAKGEEKYLGSFVGVLALINKYFTQEDKNKISSAFMALLFSPAAQQLYKGDPANDKREKEIAFTKLVEILKVPVDKNELAKTLADYYSRYKAESINEADAPDYKRQGIKHIYNPGSTVEMKDADFLAFVDSIAKNGGTLDNIPVTLKVDGAGIRFGKDQSGKPFFMTSRVTTPIYADQVGMFEKYSRDNNGNEEQIARAEKYDQALSMIVNSDFIKVLPKDTIVQAEMMYNAMAEKTNNGLKFVNISYDPKKLGKQMTLVPIIASTYSTGEALPNTIIQKIISKSTPQIKIIGTELEHSDIDVKNIVEPIVKMDNALRTALSSKKKNDANKAKAKEILSQARKAISDAIINSANIKGKDKLGDTIEGLVIAMPNGQLAKVTSTEMKGAMAAKAVKKAPTTGGNRTKAAVVTAGSFVGHVGHQKVVDEVIKAAQRLGGDPYVYISSKVGPDDPIPPEVKVATWKKLYPQYADIFKLIVSPDGVTVPSPVKKIEKELVLPVDSPYKKIVLMVGTDRYEGFKKWMDTLEKRMKDPVALAKYGGTQDQVSFDTIAIPRGAAMGGIDASFTQLRDVLKDPNLNLAQKLEAWKQGFGNKLDNDWVKKLMMLTAKGMGIKLDEVAKITLSNDPTDLGAYIRDSGKEEPTTIIPVHKIIVFEPDDLHAQKPNFEANMKKLLAALKKGDKLPPILVRRVHNGYQVLDGHHRLKAYKHVGLKSIPARIVDPANIKMKEAKKSPWDKMVAAVPKLKGSEERSQAAIAGIKKANKDYQDIIDREKVNEKVTAKTDKYYINFDFADGPVYLTKHLLERLALRELKQKDMLDILTSAKKIVGDRITNLSNVDFVIKRKDGLGYGIKKILQPDDSYKYVIATAHDEKNYGKYQTRYFVESDDLNIKFHDTLNPKLFDSSNRMSPVVREKLLQIAEDFKQSLGIEIPNLVDITVSGSNAAYSYTPMSDIDLHLVVDLPDADNDQTYRELFDAKKFQYNEQHDYKIKGFDVELYVQNANEEHISQGIYSVMNNSWVKEPQAITAEYDEVSTRAKYEQIKYLIQKALFAKDYDLASRLRQTIKKYRQVGLQTTGEFGPENLAFKALRSNGYIKKLYDLLNDLRDREFSLESSEQRLTEIDMSPGALKKFSASNIAKSTSVGFEFEMIVPNMVDPYNVDYSEPDYDYDGYVESNTVGALQRDLINFFRDTATTRQVERAVEEFSDKLNDYIHDQFVDWLADNQDQMYEMYRDWTNLETDEEIKASIDDGDADYDKIIEKMSDQHNSEWNDLDGALEYHGLQMYSDWSREYDLDWPHYTEGGSGEIDDDALREVAQEIKNAVGMPVKSAAGYHAFKSNREPGVWYLETDSSINASESDNEGGLELVSPPLPLEQALEKLDQVLTWMQGHGAYTDSSTGFHMGVSIPEMENVDYIKLILFLGDKYVLDEFGRLGNSYTRSALSKMEVGNAPYVMKNMPGIFDALRGGLEKAALKMLAASLVPRNDKYTSVNIKDQYVEFRSAGGNYLEAIEKIKNTLLRYVRVMAIAADPNDAKQEYAKKLYKLLASAAANEKDLDVIKWFTMYSSGNIAKAELVARLKQAQAKRKVLKVLDTSWTLIGMYDRPITVIQAKTEEEAWAKGREWEKSNPVNGGLRGIRQSTEDDIKQLTAASNSEPAGPWQRWIVYGTGDDGRNVRLTAVSARDRQEASRLAFRWGRDNNRVVTGLNPEDEDLVDIANIYHRNESKEIVTELANKPYPYKADWDRDETTAYFTTDAGIDYRVSIGVEDEDFLYRANIVFYGKEGSEKITNTGDAFRVLATVVQIVKTYLAKYKGIKEIEFAAELSEPSRVKLYNAFGKMLPKFILDFKFKEISHMRGADFYYYERIKKPTTFKEYVEESARPFVWQKDEPKKEFTDMQLACILGGQEYTGEID